MPSPPLPQRRHVGVVLGQQQAALTALSGRLDALTGMMERLLVSQQQPHAQHRPAHTGSGAGAGAGASAQPSATATASAGSSAAGAGGGEAGGAAGSSRSTTAPHQAGAHGGTGYSDGSQRDFSFY